MMYLMAVIIGMVIMIWDVKGGFLFGSLIFLAGVITQLFRYGFQVMNYNEIRKMRADIETYKEQANEVLAEVRLYLCEKYPEHELKVFEMITKNTVDILAVKYPEIKSNESIMKAVNNIIKFNEDIYSNQRKINGKICEMRTRKSTIWLTGLPILPDYDLE